MGRISRAYFPSSAHTRSDVQGVAFMFTRDVPLGIMPYRSSRRGSSFNAKLNRPNANLEAQLPNFLDVGQYSQHNLPDAIIEFVDTLTHYLAALGDIYIEIVDDDPASENSSSTILDGKSLEILPRGKVLRVFKWYVQIVPLKDWKKGDKKAIFIPAKNMWHLTLPNKLGSPRKHRRLIRKLNKLAEPMPKFALKDGDLGNKAKYDFMLHHKRKDFAIEYVTKTWGSIPSLRQIKGTTEYYYIVHSLQFSYCQALIREHIIAELNDVLRRLGGKNPVKVEGLPLAKDIKEAIFKMQKGEIGFKEAIDITKTD